ncbi:MAG: FimV/HubP family polar landmark protein, partial [Kingella sp. (in: b-proteobacteria)]
DIVSESVGMTAPLEAKLELAKMYLEIDDAVAARETLRELISESTGSVQAQAKELLEELGG